MLYLVRHARTAANAAGRLQGRIDPPLDEVGVAQAEALAHRIVGLGLDVGRVVASPLQRARQTAEALGLPLTIDERWIEQDYGTYDGQPLATVPAEVWERWRSDPDFVPPAGESHTALAVRVMAACADLVEEARASDVVVVSHVTPIKAAVCWALGVGIENTWRMHLDHTSITRVDIGPRGPVLRAFNALPH